LKFWLGLSLYMLITSLSASPSEPVCVQDDLDKKVCVTQKPMRIATLSPHSTELVAEIVAHDRIVAVSAFSNYPASMLAKPVIANHAGISLEALVGYQLDLIVAWSDGVSAEQKRRIDQLDIPIYYSNPITVEGIKENLHELGVLTNESSQASVAQQRIDRAVSEIDDSEKEERPSALFLISQQPLMALSNQGIAGEALRYCGIENLFADSKVPAPLVNMESIISEPPDIIIQPEASPEPAHMFALIKESGHSVPTIVTVEPDIMFRASPRFVKGIQDLCLAVTP